MISSKSARIAIGVGVLLLIVITSIVIYKSKSKPSSHTAQISYTIGAKFGESLKGQGIKLDTAELARGMEHGLEREKLLLTEPEMQEAMLKLNEERQASVKIEAEKNKSAADDFLMRNRVAENVKTTPSGLQYIILSEGTGAFPKGDDIVTVNYRGTLIDGTEFDASTNRSAAAEFPISGVIPGWTEGLKLLKKGGKAKFFIPPELAYGDRPRKNIPPNSVIIFDVELVNIRPAGSIPDKSPSARKRR